MCFQISNNCAYTLNIIALTLDVIGVIALFYAREKGLKEIKKTKIISLYETNENSDVFDRLASTAEVPKSVEEKVNEIISNILITQSENEKIVKKSLKWIVLIVIGSLLQILANFHFLS